MVTTRTRRGLFAVLTFAVLLLSCLPVDAARHPQIAFTLTGPGVAIEDTDTLLVAARLNNTGEKTAFKVRVESIRLDHATRVAPTKLPLLVGDLSADQSATVEADFKSAKLIPGHQFRLVLQGSYRRKGQDTHDDDGDDDGDHDGDRHKKRKHRKENERQHFTVSSVVIVPPAAPGSAPVKTATVPSQHVTGAPFPSQPVKFDSDVNTSRWTVPTGTFVPGTPTLTGTGAQKAPIGDPNNVTFNLNDRLGVTSGSTNGTASTVAEPSGATGGGVIFVAANWLAAYSTDGGTTFHQLDPTTIFPNDAVGFCCDQIVQYVPSIDRFIWLLQGNGVRIASASPADIKNFNGTAWTYWNLTTDVFGQPGIAFDYPDLSVGTNYLYMSWNAGVGCAACDWGHQVARTLLSQIQAGGSIGIDYTDPANGRMAWGAHLSQDTQEEIFWAGHNSNSSIRVFSLAEGSNTYFWRDIGISSWANSGLSSTTPDGQDWLNKLSDFPGTAVIGATRSGSQLWLGWSAGTDSNFQQPHVQLLTLDNNFNVVQQVQIWNNSYAFAYPALATNACTGEIGLSLEYGGNGNYENHVVGFWGDFLVYITTNSNVGSTRFGDYVTIRQDPTPGLNGAFFDAFGYGLDSVPPPAGGTQTDIRYVVFGRGGACSEPPIK